MEVAQAPSDLEKFYRLLETLTERATPKGKKSPLKPLDKASRAYVTSACATVWGLPLQKFWETQGVFLNGDDAKDDPPISTINEVLHVKGINTSDAVVSPNTQVLYSNAWLDLSKGGVTVQLPDPGQGGSTYTMAQLMDPYTNVQYSVQNSSGSASFYWRGAPPVVQREALKGDPDAIGLESPQAWLLTRTLVDPYQNRDGGVSPTSAYLDRQLQPSLAFQASQKVNEQVTLIMDPSMNDGNEGVPLSPVRDSDAAKEAAGFFSQLNSALESNGLRLRHRGTTQGELGSSESLVDQSDLLERLDDPDQGLNLRGIVRPDTPLSDDVNQGFEAARAAIDLISSAGTASERSNYWTVNTSLGQYAPNYSGWITAAAVAHVGLGANLAAYGTYPTATQDSQGKALESHLDYELDFSSSGLPPVEKSGFWSLTVYQDDQSVVDNNPQLNRYYLSGSTAADQVYALGSVQLPDAKGSSLRMSFEAPENPKRWLPLPHPAESPTFNAMLRLYEPTPADRRRQPSILRELQGWTPPAIQRLATTTDSVLQRSKVIVDLDADLRLDISEDSFRSDADGLFLKPEVPSCVLISKGGRDRLTGVPYNGVFLGASDAMVLSPLSTLEWTLGEIGDAGPQSPKRWIKSLIDQRHEELFGRKPASHMRGLHSPTSVSPHQLSRLDDRGSDRLALTYADLNHGLGVLFSGVLAESKRNGGRKISAYVADLKAVVADLVRRRLACEQGDCAADEGQGWKATLVDAAKSSDLAPELQTVVVDAFDGLLVASDESKIWQDDAQWISHFSEQRSLFDQGLEPYLP